MDSDFYLACYHRLLLAESRASDHAAHDRIAQVITAYERRAKASPPADTVVAHRGRRWVCDGALMLSVDLLQGTPRMDWKVASTWNMGDIERVIETPQNCAELVFDSFSQDGPPATHHGVFKRGEVKVKVAMRYAWVMGLGEPLQSVEDEDLKLSILPIYVVDPEDARIILAVLAPTR